MYTNIGRITIPNKKLLVDHCATIKAANLTIEGIASDVNDVLVELLGGASQKLRWLTPFQTMSLRHRIGQKNTSIAFVLHYLLHANGRADAVPDTEGYRNDPSLSLSEVLDRMVVADVPDDVTNNILPPKEVPMSIGQLATCVFWFVEEVTRFTHKRPVYSTRLRTLLSHIKFKVRSGGTLSPFEKSLWMHAVNPTYGHDAGNPLNPNASVFEAVESGDPLIATFAGRMEASCLPGPKLNYWGISSNARDTDLIISVGPAVSNLKFAAGYQVQDGSHTRFELKEYDPHIMINRDSQLLGLINRTRMSKATLESEIVPEGDRFGLKIDYMINFAHTSFMKPSENGPKREYDSLPMIFDLPEVDLVWYKNGVQYRYMSSLNGRMVTTWNPSDILIELARKHTTVGNTATISHLPTLDGYIDAADINRGLFLVESKVLPMIRRIEDDFFVLKVPVRRAGDSSGAVKWTTVDMRPFMAEYGNTFVRPWGVQFVQLPLDALETPQNNAVAFIGQMLGLSTLDSMLTRRAFTICVNAFFIELVGASLPQLPESKSGLSALHNYAESSLMTA